MSWLDQLQQASFRGVPFQVDTIEVQAGDNVVLREYPFQDLPQVFRMGLGAELIKFSAYVIGDDYQQQRDALRQVLTGDGILVHPTAGSLRVFVADRFTMQEAPLREGGVVRFDLSFVRAEPRTYPVATISTQAQATDAAQAAKAAAQDKFAAEFDVKTAPAWVQERVVDRMGAVLSATRGKLSAASANLGEYTDAVVASYQVLRSGLNDLVKAPTALAGSVREMFDLPSELSSGVASSFRVAFEGVFGIGSTVRQNSFEAVIPATMTTPAMLGLGLPEAVGLNTPARKRLQQLNEAVDQMTDTMALAAWVESIAADDLGGYDDVMKQRALLYTRCTELLLRGSTSAAPSKLTTTSWHDAVMALMSAGLGDLQARGRDQVRLSTYTPEVWMSVWQLSYMVYGTSRWVDEILRMNPHIEHPMLVPPGKLLRLVMHD